MPPSSKRSAAPTPRPGGRRWGGWLLALWLTAQWCGAGVAQTAPKVLVTPIPPLPASAQLLHKDQKSLLTLQGPVKTLRLSRAQLLNLPQTRFTTRQPQLGRSFTFVGVTLRELARLGGFLGHDLRVYSSNGFMAIIPAREYLNAPIMLAHSANRKPIPTLQKGPLEIVLPPTLARYQTEAYGAYWVWFVNRISPVP